MGTYYTITGVNGIQSSVVQLSSVLIDSVECGDSVATSRVFSTRLT